MSRILTISSFDTLQDEPAACRPDDVVYPASEEDASTGEERLKKRRRIMQAGLDYLKGKEPFILTASLRGPFDRGWTNPWAKGRPASRGQEAKRRKLAVKQESLEDVQAFQRVAIPDTEGKQAKVEHDAGFERHVTPTVMAQPQALNRHRDEASVLMGNEDAYTPGNEAFSKRPGQADWLKRDRASRLAKTTRHKSPSPVPAPRLLIESRTPQTGQIIGSIADPSRYVHRHSDGPRTAHKSPKVSPATHALLVHHSTSGSKQDHTREGKAVSDIDDDIQVAEIATPNAMNPISHAHEEDKTSSTTRSSERRQNSSPKREEHGDKERRIRHRSSRVQPPRGASGKERGASSHEQKDKTEDRARSGLLKPAKSDRRKLSPRALPPSTYQPVFEYQVPRKSNSVPSNDSTPFESALEHMSISSENESVSKGNAYIRKTGKNPSSPATARAGKSKATLKLIGGRRLTFTPNGGPSVQRERSASQVSVNSRKEVNEGPRLSGPEEGVTTKTSTKSSDRPHAKSEKSKESTGFLPEAQIVPDPLRARQLVSEPSTDMLETDKKSIMALEYNDEDSYADLATQAAMEKARQRFNDDIIADLKTPVREINEHLSRSKSSRLTTVHRGIDSRELQSQNEEHTVPMDTQAMINGMSPFDLMTSKKRSPVQAAKSPIEDPPTTQSPTSPISPTTPVDFPRNSPSMDTSPSNPEPPKGPTLPPYHYSPPATASPKSHSPTKSQRQPPQSHAHPEASAKTPTLSALTSFSINPNGTLTEISAIQDGQQPEPLMVANESYTTLPEISFSNTAISHAHPDPQRSAEDRSMENSRKPVSHGTPLSSAESRGNERSDRASNGIPRSSIDQASGKRLSDGTPKKFKLSPSKSAQPTPGSNNSIPKSSGQSQPLPSPLESPLSGKKTRNATTFVFGDSSSMTRNDEDLEAALDDAGSFLGDWSVDAELRRGGLNSVNKGKKIEGARGGNAGRDTGRGKGILSKSKGRERRSK